MIASRDGTDAKDQRERKKTGALSAEVKCKLKKGHLIRFLCSVATAGCQHKLPSRLGPLRLRIGILELLPATTF